MRQLFIKQKVFKITDHYPVLDENKNEVYFVDEDFKVFGKTLHVTRADGTHVFTINQELFRLLNRFEAKFYDGRTISLKQKFKLLTTGIDLISDDYELSLQGDILGLNFEVMSQDTKVGHIYREFFTWGDAYVIDVLDREFEEELLALMIMVDFIKDSVDAGIASAD